MEVRRLVGCLLLKQDGRKNLEYLPREENRVTRPELGKITDL